MTFGGSSPAVLLSVTISSVSSNCSSSGRQRTALRDLGPCPHHVLHVRQALPCQAWRHRRLPRGHRRNASARSVCLWTAMRACVPAKVRARRRQLAASRLANRQARMNPGRTEPPIASGAEYLRAPLAGEDPVARELSVRGRTQGIVRRLSADRLLALRYRIGRTRRVVPRGVRRL